MELSLFKTAWGAEGTLGGWVQQCRDAGFAGLEAPAPLDAAERAAFFDTLAASGLAWIAEVSTCTPTGLYVPTPHGSVAQHLASLRPNAPTQVKAPQLTRGHACATFQPHSCAARAARSCADLRC
jgi:hypothetical protein